MILPIPFHGPMVYSTMTHTYILFFNWANNWEPSRYHSRYFLPLWLRNRVFNHGYRWHVGGGIEDHRGNNLYVEYLW